MDAALCEARMSAILTPDYVNNYVTTLLGGSGRVIELKPSDFQVAQDDALRQFSWYIKKTGHMMVENVMTTPGSDSTVPVTMPVGTTDVTQVSFLVPTVASNSVPNIYLIQFYNSYGNTGPRISDVYQMEQFRKSFNRTTGTQDWWHYNQSTGILLVYAPSGPYNVGISYLSTYTSPTDILSDYDNLFLRLMLVGVKKILGRIRSKFSGSVPGSVDNLTLDGSALLAEAAKEDDELQRQMISLRQIPIVIRA